ncbi:MAG: YdeI/OmpD-associated family protein [Rhodobacterales bacterium]|jgi:uncharacterized protein YdeI (YjbR/CyaY-like superfamily)
MITEVGDYFARGCGRCDRFATPGCSVQLWHSGLQTLRHICRDTGLTETVKWGQPCYMHAGRNVAILGALRSDFRLSFFDAALMKDPAGILEQAGPNTRHAGVIRISDTARAVALAPVIRSYLQEAMGYAEAGIRPARENRDFALPAELADALKADPELATAFQNLTPGRKTSYLINLNAAKTPATRTARIARFRPAILAGKGATERRD